MTLNFDLENFKSKFLKIENSKHFRNALQIFCFSNKGKIKGILPWGPRDQGKAQNNSDGLPYAHLTVAWKLYELFFTLQILPELEIC